MNTKRREGDIESEGLTEQKFKEEDLDLDSMDHLDYEQYSQGNPLDMSDVVISTDLSEIVESICKDGGFPDSPPDSGSEHLLSPSSMVNPESVGGYTNVGANIGADEYYLANNHMRSNNPRDYTNTNMLPDLSKINYTVPMQMIEEDYKSIVVQGGSVMYKDHTDQPPQVKRRRSQEKEVPSIPTSPLKIMKTEPPMSPDNIVVSPGSSSTTDNSSIYHFANSIRFTQFYPEKWLKMTTARLGDIGPPHMTVTADKGFNFSGQDDAFIVQKKNHFQLTCDVALDGTPRFVKRPDGTLQEISYLQVNFYGVKSDIPSTQIKVEQSQADRSKKEFAPVKLDLNQKGNGSSCNFQVTVGRLHFAETTSNNMRKKGKPNPSQKYFQLIVSLEAVTVGINSARTQYETARMASERLIVRASNPGQFEADNEPPWIRDLSSDAVYHMGRVAINTEQGSEALTVHGNIQLSGQVMQPSDVRIKRVLREVDPKEQLENVKKIKIVQYKYRPEFLSQLPQEERHQLQRTPHTGIIAQDIRQVLPDAVSTSGSYVLANGKEIEDMLIVNKDRIFLENLGAVRELAMNAGDLGVRVDDLEKANESVAVRLSKLRRGGSVKSTASSFNSDPDDFKPKRKNPAKTLFQNRCIQMILLALVAAIAISLVSIATVYIIDYHARQDSNENSVLSVTLQNESHIIQETIEVFEHENEITKAAQTVAPLTSVMTTMSSSTTLSTTIPISMEIPVIGAITGECSLENVEKCKFFCCSQNTSQEFPIQEDYIVNDIFLVEPESFIVPSTAKSPSVKTRTTTTTLPLSTSTFSTSTTSRSISAANIEKNKLMQLLNSESLESEKRNQVLDDVTKSTLTSLDIKEEKIDLKPIIKDLGSTEKPGAIKVKPSTSKSLKKDENVNEVDVGEDHLNEVFDFDESESDQIKSINETNTSNTTDDDLEILPQRAKRAVTLGGIREQFGYFVTGLVRKIRDTAGHTLAQDKMPSRVQMSLTGTPTGNISLDNRFCDRDVPSNQLNDCVQGLGYNASLTIPISRHFRDSYVNLVFQEPTENSGIVMCTVDSRSLTYCDQAHEDTDLSAVTESGISDTNNSYHVHVGMFRSIHVKFRMIKRFARDPMQARRNLCRLSDNKLGAIYEEINLRFYRSCDS